MTDELEFYYGQPTPDTDVALAEPVGAHPAGTILHDVLLDLDDRIAYLETTNIVISAISGQAVIRRTSIAKLFTADSHVRGARTCWLWAKADITDATTQVFTGGTGLTVDAEINDDRRKVEVFEAFLKTLCTNGGGEQVVLLADLHTGWGPVRIYADIYFSMSVNFINGVTTWRIRRDSIAGAVLATTTRSVSSLDVDTSGWKIHWTWAQEDTSPTTGVYVLTVETNASTVVSAQRYFSLDNTFALTADAVVRGPVTRYLYLNAQMTDATTVVFTGGSGLSANAFMDWRKTFTANAIVKRTPQFTRPRRFLADARIIRPMVSTTHGTSLAADAHIGATVVIASYVDNLFRHVIVDQNFDAATSLGDEEYYNVQPRDPSTWTELSTLTPTGSGKCARYYKDGEYWYNLYGYTANAKLMELIPNWTWYPSWTEESNPPIRWAKNETDVRYTYRLEFDFYASIATPTTPPNPLPDLGPYVIDFSFQLDNNYIYPEEKILLAFTSIAADAAWHHVVLEFDPDRTDIPFEDGLSLLDHLNSGPYVRWTIRDPETDLRIYELSQSRFKVDFRMDNVLFTGWPRGYKTADVRSVDGVTEVSSVRFTMDAVLAATRGPDNIALNPNFSRELGKMWWYPAHASGTGYCYVCSSDSCSNGEVLDLNPNDYLSAENSLQVETYGLIPYEGAKTPFPAAVGTGVSHDVIMQVKPVGSPATLRLSIGDETPVYDTVATRPNLFGETDAAKMAGWAVEKNPLWNLTLASSLSYPASQASKYPSVSSEGDVLTVKLGAGHGAYGNYTNSLWQYNHWHSATRIVYGDFRAGQTYIFRATIGDIVPDPYSTSFISSTCKNLSLGVCAPDGSDVRYSDPVCIDYNWSNPETADAGQEPYPEYYGYTNYAKPVWVAWRPSRSYSSARVAIGPMKVDNYKLAIHNDKQQAPYSFTVTDLECAELWGEATNSYVENTSNIEYGTTLTIPDATESRTIDVWYDVPGSAFTAYGRAGYARRAFVSLVARDSSAAWEDLNEFFGLRFRLLRVEDGTVVAQTQHDYRYIPKSGGVDDGDRAWASSPVGTTDAAIDTSFSGTDNGFLADYTPETYILQFGLKVIDPYAAADAVNSWGPEDFWSKWPSKAITLRAVKIHLDLQDPTGYAGIAPQLLDENIITNPDFATDTTGWTNDNTGNPWSWRDPSREGYWVGPATLTRITNDGAWYNGPSPAVGGSFNVSTCLEIAFPTSWDTGVYSVNAIGIEPGDIITVRFWSRYTGTRNRYQWAVSGPNGEDRYGFGNVLPWSSWDFNYVSYVATSSYSSIWFGVANWGPNALTLRISHVSVDVHRQRAYPDNIVHTSFSLPADEWSVVSGTWVPERGSHRPIVALTMDGTDAGVFRIDDMYLGRSGTLLFADADLIDGTRTTTSITADAVIFRAMPGSFSAEALMLVGYLREFEYLTCDAIIGWSMYDFYLRDEIADAYEVMELLQTSLQYYPNWHDGYWFKYWEQDDYWDPPAATSTVLMGVTFDNSHGPSWTKVIGTRADDDPLNPLASMPAQTYWAKLTLDVPTTVNLSTYGPPAEGPDSLPYSNFDTTLSLFRDTTPDEPTRTLELVSFHDDIGNVQDLPQGIKDELFWTIATDTAYVYASHIIGLGVPAGTYYIEVEADPTTPGVEGGYLYPGGNGYTVLRVWLTGAFTADSYIAHHIDMNAVIHELVESGTPATSVVMRTMGDSIPADAEMA